MHPIISVFFWLLDCTLSLIRSYNEGNKTTRASGIATSQSVLSSLSNSPRLPISTQKSGNSVESYHNNPKGFSRVGPRRHHVLLPRRAERCTEGFPRSRASLCPRVVSCLYSRGICCVGHLRMSHSPLSDKSKPLALAIHNAGRETFHCPAVLVMCARVVFVVCRQATLRR